MNLRIEQGLLLKPYLAPYMRKDGGSHRMRKGWTPDRTPELQKLFDDFRAMKPDAPEAIVWKMAEVERGNQLAEFKRPYPGWFPIGPQSDKAISRAYRALFRRMNPDADKRVKLAGRWSGPKAVYPPDGDYTFEHGVMRPATNEHGIAVSMLRRETGEGAR